MFIIIWSSHLTSNFHHTVLIHDGKIAFEQGLIDAAILVLNGVHDTVTGPISSALEFIAEGVNLVLGAIPLVIKGVFFQSTLSTASSSGVNLEIDYSFINEDYSLEFGFNFSVRDAGAIIGDFCKEIASKILGLADDNTRIAASDVGNDPFTFDELMNAKNMVDELEKELNKESEQMELDYEFDKTELKRTLFRSEEAMLQLRDHILEEHKFTTEEDKVVMSNIEKIVSGDNAEGGFQALSDDDTSEYVNAVESIKALLGEIEGKANEEKQQLVTFTTQLRATQEEMLQEESQEEAEFARISSSGGNEEEKEEMSNEVKRRAIESFKKHELKLRAAVEEDRDVGRSIISARKGLYDQTLTHMSTLKSLSDHFSEKIIAAGQKRAKKLSKVSAHVASAESIDAPGELDECEAMILNMSMYQYNLASANRSIQNRSNYDKWLMEVSVMEDNMLSTLDLMGDDGAMGTNRMSKVEAN